MLDLRFQGRIAFLVVLAGLLCIGTTAYLYYAYVGDSYAFILKYSTLPQEIASGRYRELYTFLLSLTAINVVIILVVAGWTFSVTHRAVGAVYHMRRVVEAVRAGNTGERIHLRERDEFQDLAKSLNALLDETQKRERVTSP